MLTSRGALSEATYLKFKQERDRNLLNIHQVVSNYKKFGAFYTKWDYCIFFRNASIGYEGIEKTKT